MFRSGWRLELLDGKLSRAVLRGEGYGDVSPLTRHYFPAVYEDLGGGMGKGQKVQRLLDYCLRRGQMEELLARVRAYNPAQYARFAPRLGEEAER